MSMTNAHGKKESQKPHCEPGSCCGGLLIGWGSKKLGLPALLLFLLLCSLACHPSSRPREMVLPIQQAADVRELAPEKALQGLPVQLKGVVTFYDPAGSRLFFLQDESHGIYINPFDAGGKPLPIKAGDLVELKGVTSRGTLFPAIYYARVRVLGQALFPNPIKLSLAELVAGKPDCQWVETEGVVQRVSRAGDSLSLSLLDQQTQIPVMVYLPPGSKTQELVDAKIRVRGVLGTHSNQNRQVIKVQVFVPDWKQVDILEPPPADSFIVPLQTVSNLQRTAPASLSSHRVRVRGTLFPRQVGEWIMLQDSTGTLDVFSQQTPPIHSGQKADVAGFPVLKGNKLVLEDAVYLTLASAPSNQSPMPGLPLLTSVDAVRKLSDREAARGNPVKVEGIVTFTNGGNSPIFFQDAQSGINLEILDPALHLTVGQRLELEGVTAAGEVSPLIAVKKVQSLGRSMLPPARPISIDRFFQGEGDCLRVELEGIVRAVYGDSNHAFLDLINGGIRYQVTVPNYSSQPLPTGLVDHRIRIRGSAGIRFNLQREISGYQLFTPDLTEVTVTEDPPIPPFDLPVRPIKDLLRFSPGNLSGHRVHIRGILLYNKIGEFLYVRDSSGAIYVQSRQEMGILPGTPVDVAGFPVMGEPANRLEDAIFQGPLPTQNLPVETITPDQVLTGRFHGDLVRVQADLINRVKTATGVTLVLRTNNMVFDASWDEREADLPNLEEGCQLALTGICLIKRDPARNSTFQLLLRTSRDIQILKAAPWLTPVHLLWILGIFLLGILFSFAWGIVLRRRVSEQTRIIRQRLEREAALEKEYRDLFENSNDVVFSFDLTGKMTSINKAGEKLLDYSRYELTQMPFDEILIPEEIPRVRQLIRQVIEGQPPIPFEVEVRARDGRRSTLEVTAEFLYQEGKPISLRGIGRDITQRKQAEAALRVSEERLRQTVKLEAIGTLAGGIAHDFNNILSAILGYTELSLMDIDDPAKVTAYLDQIHNAGRRARDLIRQILTFSQKLPHERRPILIQPLLEDAVKLLRATLPTTIEMQLRIVPGCKPVLGDSSQLHQVILNLGTNASHAMRSTGGRLEFHLQPLLVGQERPAWQAGLPEGDYNCLTVRDTGHGINPEVLKRIFDPYFTTKPFGDGSGLGLAVVQGIVENHKGVILVDSQPGQGTTFRIFLPSQNDLIIEPEKQKAELPLGKEYILFVDDEESIVYLMGQALEKLGHTVITQTNSLSALTLFHQSPQTFTLVITDQTMPHLTGMKLAQKIKALRPELPIILCTGFSEDATPEEAYRVGISAHLYKPVSIHELTKIIQQVIRKTHSPDAGK